MQKGFLLYVRFNREWTEVYGPRKSIRSFRGHTVQETPERKPDEHYDTWYIAVPVADDVKLALI